MSAGFAQTGGQSAPSGERGTQQQQQGAPSGREGGAPAQRGDRAPQQNRERGAQQNQQRDPNTGQAQREREMRPGQQRERNRGANENRQRDPNTGQAQRERDMQREPGQRERNRANQNRQRDPNTGQAHGEREMQRDRDRGPNQRDRDRGPRDREMQREPSRQQGRTQRDSNTGSVNVQVTDEQRTRIREHRDVLVRHRVDHVDFDVRIGTRVPRTVRVYDLPREVVEIVPAYRRYKYIMIGDEIVIVDPRTLEIVAVIPA